MPFHPLRAFCNRSRWLPGMMLVFGMTFTANAESDSGKVDFNYDIRPIISQKCYHCHGPDEGSRKAKLRMDIREEAMKDRDGFRAIVPGDIKASEMIVRIHSKDEEEKMPPPHEGEQLTAKEIELLTKWIEQGAEYKTHWAWEKPVRPAIPQVKDGGVVRNPVDAFILEKLPRKGLKQSPEADRHTLIRRLTLDLIGLPPTPDEVKAFVEDQTPDFYEKAVDRLLASPRFGERWAQMWLDLARYGDSTGYGSDNLRLNIWPYRDWVIQALNANMPYDQFTTEQLAGDLLPNATREQISATAFHRNTLTNVEGGTIDEEYRVAAVKDRIATTSQVWMGITMQCAQCHTHKFDPITHKDYYSFYAIFNQTEDNDLPSEAPKIPLPTKEETDRKQQLENEIAGLEKKVAGDLPELEAERHEWEATMARKVEWQTLEPVSAVAASGATLTKQPDGSLLAGGTTPQTDFYTVKVKADLAGVSALRLEAIPDPSLPANGPGRAGNGNALLSEMRVAFSLKSEQKKRARYVIVQRTQKALPLSLAEVEVFSNGINIARTGRATQSSTDYEGDAARAIDGNTEGDYFKANSVSHTKAESAAWWELDLGTEQEIDSIVIWNRTDNGMGDRLEHYNLILRANDAKTQIYSKEMHESPNPTAEFYPGGDQLVGLRNPSADFSQQDWGVEGAIDGSVRSGWAFHPESGKTHAAVFELTQPIKEAGEKELTFTFRQHYGERHVLGRFRLLATKANHSVRELPPYIKDILAREPTEREPHQRVQLDTYFRPISKAQNGLQDQLAQKRAALAGIRPVELPIMRELPPDKLRATHILDKGNYLAPREKVEPRLPEELAKVTGQDGPMNRLSVANWLLHTDNPLTARVAVNRFWSQIFGTGIVETEEDFGTQGALPTHPELLDWLAVVFKSGKSRDDATLGLGWDMKAFLRLLVTSATYRQSSQFTPAHAENDARNRYLSRYPRRRLEAETVRDQSLALAGLLSGKIGGPSVYPPQPDGLWNVAFNGGQNNYPTSSGEDRYRRGLYIFLRRTMPYPSMNTFDAPSRESCTLRRKPTNTPLQAFVTLNDPCFVEAAQALARRIVKEGGADTATRIKWALNLALGKPASDSQIAAVQMAFDQELARQKADPAAATKLATEPLGKLPEGMDPAELAAWTVIANTLLNLDAVLTKG